MTAASASALLERRPNSQLADRYEALFRVSAAICAQHDPQVLFATLARELGEVIDFDFIGVACYDEASGHAEWLLAECDDPCEEPDSDCDLEQTVTRWVLENQQPLVIDNIEHDTRFPELRERLSLYGIRSVCALPLTTVHRRIGLLALGSKRQDAYTGAEIGFLSLVSNQVAIAIGDAQSWDASRRAQSELERERDRLRLLLDVNRNVVSNLELRDLLRAVSASVRRVMRSDVVGIEFPDSEPGQLRIHALDFPDSKGHLREDLRIPIEGTAAGRAFQTGEPVAVSQADPDHMKPQQCLPSIVGEGLTAGCFLPLAGRKGVMGVLCLGRRGPDSAFRPDEVEFLGQVAGQVAIALENTFAYGEIAELKDRLAQEKIYLEDEIRSQLNFEEIVGDSLALRRVLTQVETVAPADSAVLIFGETGTGKELIARAIHNLSRRKDRTFVKLNCAAIPTGLLESELFGHEKGAFTGAIAQRIGRFELADNGTIFLDEVGDIPLELQPKLLRVLQEREFERLGNGRTLKTDARLVAATNRDLAAMVDAQEFRSDLYYRLNVFPVRVPPLRERAEDIPLLVRHFAQQFARRNHKEIESIPTDTMNELTRYHWPGNIRELQNVIERAVILSNGPVLKVPLSELKERTVSAEAPKKQETLQDAERKHIIAALEGTNWVVGGRNGAAARLGMKRSTLQFRMGKLGISRPGK